MTVVDTKLCLSALELSSQALRSFNPKTVVTNVLFVCDDAHESLAMKLPSVICDLNLPFLYMGVLRLP